MEKILFMVNGKPSMVAGALMQGLMAARYEVIQIAANVMAMSLVEDTGKIWVLFLQGKEDLEDLLHYIREQLEEAKDIRFYVAGTGEELDHALKDFPEELVTEKIKRPFSVGDVTDMIRGKKRDAGAAAQKRILIVDDDPVMLRTLKELLQDKYRVFMANSGMTAVQMLVNTQVDLILLDYEMPVVKGPQVLEMLRSDPKTANIPVMFLTSKSDRESVVQVMSMKVANYLLKSQPQAELKGIIDQFFAGQGAAK